MSPLTIAIGEAVTTRQTVDLPGSFSQRVIDSIKINIPDTTNGVTFKFEVLDPESVARMTEDGLADNSDILIMKDVENIIVKPGYKYGITPSGATGNDITISIYPDYRTWKVI